MQRRFFMQSRIIIIRLMLIHKDLQAISDTKTLLPFHNSSLDNHSICFFHPIKFACVEYPL